MGFYLLSYLVGERTPHADATIRGSFIGMDASHKRGILQGQSLKELPSH